MQVVRVYTGDDGRSHFEDVVIPLADTGSIGRISELIRGPGVMFREDGGDYDIDFHNAPRRQFVVNLTGAVDIAIGDGTVRRLGPGDILLAEDTHGEGHTSRAVDGEPGSASSFRSTTMLSYSGRVFYPPGACGI